MRQVCAEALESGVGQLIQPRAVEDHLAEPSAEGHVTQGRAAEGGARESRPVEASSGEGRPVQVQAAPVGVGEVDPAEVQCSKRVRLTSVSRNLTSVRATSAKFAPRSELHWNFPFRAEIPAKSPPARSLPSKRVTTCRSNDCERWDTSRTVCSMSAMLSTVSAKAFSSSLPRP